MSIHSEFILTPVANILHDTAIITCSMNCGIEMYPLWDNIMQSVFMKMTGAQEQKMKCVCWEIATVDFDLRRDIYYPWELNECSRIEDKKKILKHLINTVAKLEKGFDIRTFDLSQIWNDTRSILEQFHEYSKNMGFCEREYQEYVEIFNTLGAHCLNQLSFFQNCANCSNRMNLNKPYTCSVQKNLNEMYKYLYRHRNRCAHNLTSYQQNRPSLDVLFDVNYVYENYYIRFALLIIIDKILISLYQTFQKEIDGLKLF